MLKRIKKLLDDNNLSNLKGLFIVFSLLLLMIGGILMIASSTKEKHAYRRESELFKQAGTRKNVFNFGKNKTAMAAKSSRNAIASSGSPSSSSSSSAGGWFSSTKTVAEQVQDELDRAMETIEKEETYYNFPYSATEEARQMYSAEHNKNLCYGRGALERGDVAEAEKRLRMAIDESRDNPFLLAYSLGELLALYEIVGNKEAREKTFKLYVDAVGKLPPEYGGGEPFVKAVRDSYQALKTVPDLLSTSDGMRSLDNAPVVKSGIVSAAEVRLRMNQIINMYPIKLE